jgi:hypothetical protein
MYQPWLSARMKTNEVIDLAASRFARCIETAATRYARQPKPKINVAAT